jgi:hypothetical protein
MMARHLAFEGNELGSELVNAVDDIAGYLNGAAALAGQFLALEGVGFAQGQALQLGGLDEEAEHVGGTHLFGAQRAHPFQSLGLQALGFFGVPLPHLAAGIYAGSGGAIVEVACWGSVPARRGQAAAVTPTGGCGTLRATVGFGTIRSFKKRKICLTFGRRRCGITLL